MSGIPPDVREFMVANLDSVEALDLLLAMVRRRNLALSAQDVSDAIGLDEMAVDGLLAHFHARGFLEVEPGSTPRFRFGPTSPKAAATILTIASLYKTDRKAILAEFLGAPDGVRAFSDAFRIRRKKGQ